MIIKYLLLVFGLVVSIQCGADSFFENCIVRDVAMERYTIEQLKNCKEPWGFLANKSSKVSCFLYGNKLTTCSDYVKAKGNQAKQFRIEEKKLADALTRIREIKHSKVDEFVKQHELYFIYADYCDNCHAISSIVRDFGLRFKFEVIAVSVDGKPLAEFSKWQSGTVYVKECLKKFKILNIPAVVLVNKNTGEVAGKWIGRIEEFELINQFAEVIDKESIELALAEDLVVGDSEDVGDSVIVASEKNNNKARQGVNNMDVALALNGVPIDA